MTPIPPIPFAVPSITDEDVLAVSDVMRSGWLTTGAQAQSFEVELREYLGAKHVIAVSSCTHALELLLASQHLPPGSAVGVPTWTFVSTALSVVHVGLRPVLLDVEVDTLNVAPESLRSEIDNLDAVVGVHFGGTAISPKISEICRSHGKPLIEDAAHALGNARVAGASGADTVGAALSFYATKNLTSGEGGAIATEDDDVARFAASHRLHGLSTDAWRRYAPGGSPMYDLVGPGWKMNFPDILAALARSQLRRFAEMQQQRRVLVRRYRDNLRATPIRFVPEVQDEESADHLLVVVLPPTVERRAVVERLNDDGIGTSVHFQPLHSFDWFRQNIAVASAGLGNADMMASRVLSLPLYPDLTLSEVDRVCDILIESITP